MDNVMGANEELAAKNKAAFKEADVVAVNVMGSPGSGKTTILENALGPLSEKYKLGVIEGDLFTTRDAERIEAVGAEVYQINTGGSCHLNAAMVNEAVKEFPIDDYDVLFIENVGNLVCPASFDLGETLRVTVFSVSEGADKAVKYPKMFRRAHAVIINKVDLLDHTDVDLDEVRKDLREITPKASIFEVSATTGEGLEDWIDWLQEQLVKLQ
jgi:hydrogenase nickel incorporation protein HypB